MYVVTPEEIRKIDKRAIKEYGIPGIVLMENAAIRTVEILCREYPMISKKGKVFVLVGCGNNGGDGLAIARHLLLKGVDVETSLLFPEESFTGDVEINLKIYKRLNGKLNIISQESHLAGLEETLRNTDLIIDSVFGTGLSKTIEGIIFNIIEKVNNTNIPVMAVDLPSGINGKNGKIMGIAIKADHTVSFGYIKRGHLLYPGKKYVGKLHKTHISMPLDSGSAVNVKAFSLDDRKISSLLKERAREGHKGTFGKVGVIGGSLGMAGAAFLSSMAAQKSGSGLVTLGCPSSLTEIFQSKMTEVMVYPLEDDGTGHLGNEAIYSLEDFLKDKDVLAIGPGMGAKSSSLKILRYILSEFDIPIVMDADALNHISHDVKLLSGYRGSIAITPHPGEMSRLTGKKVDEIIESPIETAEKFARDMGIVVLLKGAASIVVNPKGEVYINSSGNSGMGTGGSGDVLTGLISALVAQGYSLFQGCVYGCYIHGKAGDRAKGIWGETGMVAGNILDELPLAFKEIYDLKKQI